MLRMRKLIWAFVVRIWHKQVLSVRRYEPPHDKSNKVTVRTVKTQISLGICPV